MQLVPPALLHNSRRAERVRVFFQGAAILSMSKALNYDAAIRSRGELFDYWKLCAHMETVWTLVAADSVKRHALWAFGGFLSSQVILCSKLTHPLCLSRLHQSI